jgi:hypothetical protein
VQQNEGLILHIVVRDDHFGENVAQNAENNWLQSGAWDRINPIWRDRMVVILEDISGLEGLKYALLLDNEGKRLSQLIGQGGPVKSVPNPPDFTKIVELACSTKEAFEALREAAPSHILDDHQNELLFIGAVAELVLVAAFEKSVSRGAVVMRLTKRIRYLKTIEKSRQRAALYV